MAAKTSWYKYGTKLRQCRPMYTPGEVTSRSLRAYDINTINDTIAILWV